MPLDSILQSAINFKMRLKKIVNFIENRFPLDLQETYDNCGLTYGHLDNEISGVLVCLDVTDEVVQESIRKKCNLIISHHPVIFKGIKKINGRSMNQRVLEQCIKNDISLYALHTNLDNHHEGVNKEIANKIGLKDTQVLLPKQNTLYKLAIYIPTDSVGGLDEALFAEGAGSIGNYSECSFHIKGQGTFKPNEHAKPSIGKKDTRERVDEVRAEYLVKSIDLRRVLNAMWEIHPYEEVAHDIIPLKNNTADIGSGMYGLLEKGMSEIEFLKKIKADFNLKTFRHTQLLGKEIKKVAVCGGSGSFLLNQSKHIKADVFITSDFKYHEFFDAENEILILDIGHWESEQYTSDLICEILNEKFSNFAIHLTEVNTNPVNYF